MTSNPTIFEKAVAGSRLYDDDIRRLGRAGAERRPRSSRRWRWPTSARRATSSPRCTRRPVDRWAGLAGGVARRSANDTEATIHEAERLWAAVDRPNAMIKIPGTEAGLPAITHCIAAGISVNVTLLFSVERYARGDRGLARRAWSGGCSAACPLGDRGLGGELLREPGGRQGGSRAGSAGRVGRHRSLRGRIAIANACAAYRLFEWSLGTPRWDRLAKAGARPQRPLWASTSTKDPRYPDVYYVEALVAPRTVNTLPPETFAAYRDHGRPAVRIQESIAAAHAPSSRRWPSAASTSPRSPASWRRTGSPSSRPPTARCWPASRPRRASSWRR